MTSQQSQTQGHTPGPWHFRLYGISPEQIAEAVGLAIQPVRMLANDGSATVMAGNDEGTKPVARVECQTKHKRGEGYRTECAERDANARLIAAAPEMLEALQLVAHDVRSGSLPTNIQNAIERAIARATGAP